MRYAPESDRAMEAERLRRERQAIRDKVLVELKDRAARLGYHLVKD